MREGNKMIRETIKSKMKELGINQSELSRRTGERKATISEYLSGKREARAGTIEKMLHELDIRLQ